MKISALADATDVPLATIKFYIREGMLQKGKLTSATSAEYTDEHIKRIRLIQALSDVRALPLAQVKEILSLVDRPLPSPGDSLAKAIRALPPYVPELDEYPLARDAIEKLGFVYDPRGVGVRQLNSAIQAVHDAGLAWNDDDILFYGDAAMSIAKREMALVMELPLSEMVATSVLGTAMMEPVLLAMRRLAHQTLHVRFAGKRPPGAAPAGTPD